MLTKLQGGKIYDPLQGMNGETRDLYIKDGRIVAEGSPQATGPIAKTYDVSGCLLMAGAIDPHSHIGGGKVNIGRLLLPEEHNAHPSRSNALLRSGSGRSAISTMTAGYRYAEMGFTSCFEPAMLPANARQAHMEMADTPIIDKGAYALLGSDDFCLRMLQEKRSQEEINQYVAWTLNATHALAIKVVNPGGINAFKFNQRKLDLDEENKGYGVTPRQILTALARAVFELGVPHPLHVHGCNLGVPGNIETTLDTITAMEGLPLHLTHIQFHSYGTEGDLKFSSGAARLAELVNKTPSLSIDVGQILFGRTITESGDSMRQYAGRGNANPNKWVVMDIECDAGCGVVPFRYRDKSFVNALQWAIGLEIFLLTEDPWRIFLTTDHPNGAPFQCYPQLMRLLMDRSYRNDQLARINKQAAAMTTLGAIEREYSLYEIAILTRAAPAKSLGLRDRGHLGAGATADVVVYQPAREIDRMFAKPRYVFKNGQLIVEDGVITALPERRSSLFTVQPEYDRAILKDLQSYFERYHTVRLENFPIGMEEMEEYGLEVEATPLRGHSA